MASSKLLVILSVASGMGALGLGHLYLTRLEQDVAGGAKVQVIATVRDLPIGSLVSKDDLAVQQVPTSYVSRRQVKGKDVGRLLGVRTNALLKAGDIIEWTDVAGGQVAGRSLADLVQPGMRGLNIASEQLFDGLLRPGDRVDLLFTSHAGSETVTLLQNLLVLAVNGLTGSAAEAASGSGSGSSVVLSLTVEQAQTITQAEQGGKLRLSLRNAEDITLLEQLPTTTKDDVSTTKERTPLALLPKQPSDVPVIERVR